VFARDDNLLDYDYESDDDWVDEDGVDGDSVFIFKQRMRKKKFNIIFVDLYI